MTVFNEYAHYYDLLYRDKDYAGEAEYIHRLIKKHRPSANSILNLGCGSGRHDQELIKHGYHINGVDISAEMLVMAEKAANSSNNLTYHHGDIRSIHLGMQFDAVISLFHVISYQITNKDLMAAFNTARTHLKPGGVFIFDCWYGPAVLTNKPEVRVKELEDAEISITRIAQPVMYPNENLVDVNYHMFVKNKHTNNVSEIKETHKMRYLFVPEIQFLLEEFGFYVATFEEWMTRSKPGFGSWNIVIVAK